MISYIKRCIVKVKKEVSVMFEFVIVMIGAFIYGWIKAAYDSKHPAQPKKRVSHVGWRSGQLRAQRSLRKYGFRFKL